MKRNGETLNLSATDLVGFLNCRYLTELDKAVVNGALPKPTIWNPVLDVLRERGALHEQAYVEYLKAQGYDVCRIDGSDVSPTAVAETYSALTRGVPVVVQGAFSNGSWGGRADILMRVETPSGLGGWSYEVIDTKLARETKAGSVLQLCVYSDLLAHVQSKAPELMHIVPPWTDFVPQSYRFADYAAYFRRVQKSLIGAIADGASETTYPEPKPHCDVCCQRRSDFPSAGRSNLPSLQTARRPPRAGAFLLSGGFF